MSVGHTAVVAYGYIVDSNENQLEDVCQRYFVSYAPVGNAYIDDVKYIITSDRLSISKDEHSEHYVEEFPQGAESNEIMNIQAAVREIMGEVKGEPRLYVGIYTH